MKDICFPRPNDTHTCHLKEIIKNPNIQVGEYTYYHELPDPLHFEENNVLYFYPVNKDKLVIGKFCSIASGAKFLFNGGNHKSDSFVNYPFAIFGDLWEHDLAVNSSWDNKGDIVIGNDVWIGYEAIIMAGVKIGNGARIATRAVVTRDVKPYEIVGGIPARPIKMRFDAETRNLLEELRWWDLEAEQIKENITTLIHNEKENLKALIARYRK